MTSQQSAVKHEGGTTQVTDAQGVAREPASVRGPVAVVPSRLFRLRTPLPGTHARLIGIAATAVMIGLWWLLTTGDTAETRIISPVVLPSPLEVARAFPVLINQRDLLVSIKATLGRVLQGFGLAILLGVPLGVIAGMWGAFRAAATPLALFFRNIPIAVLIPLTMFWFGIDETQKVLFIFLATVPFVFADTVAAIVTVPDRYVETAQTLGAKWHQVVMKVLIPLSLPDIYNSLRNLFGLAFGYIMLAELVNAKHGLGYMINTSQRLGQREDIFAILVVICLIALGIDALLRFFQRGLFPYRGNQE
jgi:ABC-type nitrate/sulfonate/bicarbonate transport system permease component